MKQFIELDAHSQNCVFAVLSEAGEVLECRSTPTDERKLVGFLKELPGEKALVFEESFMSKWLYAVLKPHVQQLTVCNPCFLPKTGKAKTDKIDAINLARQLRAGNVVPVFHVEQDELFDLRKAVRSYRQLITQVIRTKNRIRMLFRSQGIVIRGTEPFKNREVFDRLSSSVDQMVGRHLFDQLQTLQVSRKAYQQFFEQMTQKNKTICCLTSIPGIESIRACVIAALVCDARRFPSKHHFWSYCSLVKHKQISDGVTYGTKRAFGRSELKEAFYGAAVAVLMFHKNSSLFAYHQSQLDRGRDRWASRVALARKMSSIALSVMRNQKPYEAEGKINGRRYRTRSKFIHAQAETS